MSAGRKKVIVRKLNREWLAGYLTPGRLTHDGDLELLDLAGKVAVLPLDGIKWICYVRDFNSGEPGNPERLLRKSFAGRPRSEGLWLRLRLTDGDAIEGLATNDLTLLDPFGILLTPPDVRSNTQRIFVPRPAMAALEIVAVVTSPARRRTPESPRQEDLFTTPE